MRINILEAKNRLSELIRAACRGEEVIIANRGRPVVRLVPMSGSEAAAPGTSQAILDGLENDALQDSQRRSAAEIDADIAAERAAWD